MIIDLALNNERTRNFKITDDENKFENERSILPVGEVKFNNARHVENTLKYFFNITSISIKKLSIMFIFVMDISMTAMKEKISTRKRLKDTRT